MTEELLETMALEYLENEISIKDLASKYHMGKSTIIGYFNGQKQIKLSKRLQNCINEKKNKRFLESKSTYGNQGNTILTKEQIVKYADIYVNNDFTFEEIVKSLNENGINLTIGTLSNYFSKDNLGEQLYNQVKAKIDINKKEANKDIKK